MLLNPVEGVERLRSAWRGTELKERSRKEKLEPRLSCGEASSFIPEQQQQQQGQELRLCVCDAEATEGGPGHPPLPFALTPQPAGSSNSQLTPRLPNFLVT